MAYDPAKHNRISIRAKGYDYSQPGWYFITICVQNRDCLFGKITDKKMILNDVGKMIEKWYFELENKYPNTKCHSHVVMPNHFHFIIEILDNGGMDVRGMDMDVHGFDAHGLDAHGLDAHGLDAHGLDAHGGTSLRGRPNDGDNGDNDRSNEKTRRGAPYGPQNKKYDATLFDMVGWFKTMTTNEYIRGVKTKKWRRFNKRLWQLRYWDWIVRNNDDYVRITKYIKNNPAKWDMDKFNR